MLHPNPMTASIDLAPSGLEGGIHNRVLAEDYRSIEVLGSVPLRVLAGFRLERTGSRRAVAGWDVGVYRMDIDQDDGPDCFED